MKTCQRHQVHILPTVDGKTSWDQTLPLASKKLREKHLTAMGNLGQGSFAIHKVTARDWKTTCEYI